MKLDFFNLPVGNLPYEDIQLCKQMMLRLFHKIPFLPELPLMDPNDEIFHRTVANIPCISFKDGKMLMSDDSEKLMYSVMKFEKILSGSAPYALDEYSSEAPFMYMYIEILKKLKPKYTVINLLGPFTFANAIFNKNASVTILDNNYRKFFVDVITIKALWYIQKIKQASPDTKPIIMFDERLLYKFGTLKRTNESITKENVTILLTKVFSRLRKEGALIGVQSFEKCNWQLVFETECVDIISFDAYNNPTSLNFLSSSVNKFLVKGGYINWAIVPVMNENVIRSLDVNTIHNRLVSTIDRLETDGVPSPLVNSHCTISIQGDLSKQPIIFAEKALMMADKLCRKLPANHDL